MANLHDCLDRAVGAGEVDKKLADAAKSEFDQLLERFPRFSNRIIRLMNTRIQALEKKMRGLVFNDVRTRICSLLHTLYLKAGDKNSGQIKVPLTHQDIANLVASSRETASLHLSELKKLGIITYERKQIRILSIETLQHYAS